MLAGNGVIFPLDQFLGHRAGVLFGDVIKAGVCGRIQLHLDCGCLSHLVVLSKIFEFRRQAEPREQRHCADT